MLPPPNFAVCVQEDWQEEGGGFLKCEQWATKTLRTNGGTSYDSKLAFPQVKEVSAALGPAGCWGSRKAAFQNKNKQQTLQKGTTPFA